MTDIIEHLRREASKQDMLACEDMLKAADEIEKLRARALKAEDLIEELDQFRSFVYWIETWVSQPASAFSTDALEGLFGMTRDRIAALSKM